MTGTEQRPIENAPWIAGDLCLDFVNTANSRTRAPIHDRLETYQDLVRWGQLAGTIEDALADELLRMADAEPVIGARVLSRAKALRETVYRIFSARADGRTADASDFAALSNAAAEAVSHRILVPVEFRFDYVWLPQPPRLERVWWPVAAAAVALATSADVTRVKECATAHCNSLFLDGSRNQTRRWCRMGRCGNRAKQQRYHARQNAAPALAEKARDLRNPGSGPAYKMNLPPGRRARPGTRLQ